MWRPFICKSCGAKIWATIKPVICPACNSRFEEASSTKFGLLQGKFEALSNGDIEFTSVESNLGWKQLRLPLKRG